MMLDGKRVLVTGAGSGIGRELCRHLVTSCGATVLAISLDQAKLESLKSELGDAIETLVIDLAQVDQISLLEPRLSDVDCLVNNAGVAKLAPFLEMTQSQFDLTMAVNVRGPLFLSQLFSKVLVSRGVSGSIVNLSSQASSRALMDHTSYCVSKAAMDQLTRNMAFELGQHGIRINSVNPTVVLTEMGKNAWGDEAKAAPMLARIPLGHFAEPQDVLDVIVFLLSDQSKMVHGANIPVDGGFWTT